MQGARFRVDQAHWTSLIDWIEHGVVPAGGTPWAEVAPGDDALHDAVDTPVAEPPADPPLRLFGVSAFIKPDP
jgi:hypothetical protein